MADPLSTEMGCLFGRSSGGVRGEKPGGLSARWTQAFAFARAAAALSFALGSDDGSAVEAVYEALHAPSPADEPLLTETVAATH
jgi:hypothetical protein